MTLGTIHHLSSQITLTNRSHSDAQLGRNASLLLKAGYIAQLGAGLYTLMPLGLRVVQKIEQIVREEMDALGASEFLSPIIYPREMWETTGRWDTIDVLYKLKSRSGSELCIAATAEEIIVSAAKRLIRSYRDLPFSAYQIQPKCRDELRARSGLVRGREFRMKDLYSFHLDSDQLDEFYEQVCQAYMRVFTRCGIGQRTVRTFASGGVFSRFSDEFQLLCESGEDTIFIDQASSIAINSEIAQDSAALKAAFGDRAYTLTEHRAIEVGNTFKLGTRFTDAFDLKVHDASGRESSVLMCSYGIGTSRLAGAIAEVCSDDKGLVWPKSVAPYDVHIVALEASEQGLHLLSDLTRTLKYQGLSALVDNRLDIRAGEKFFDSDLLGIPKQIILGNRTGSGQVEVKDRTSAEVSVVRIEEVVNLLQGPSSAG
jgi:prolyl-tRNA synthetase